MSKVTDIDGAFEDRIRADWSAKKFLNVFNLSIDDLRHLAIREGNYQYALDEFKKDELAQCRVCKEWYDDPKDTKYIANDDDDGEDSLCNECIWKSRMKPDSGS